MFPHDRPATAAEVNRFMSGLGGSTRTTVPRSTANWQHFNPRAKDAGEPASIHYYPAAYPQFGGLATFDARETMFGGGNSKVKPPEPERWFHAVLQDSAGLFDTDPHGFHMHSAAYRPFRLLDVLGDLLVQHGYPRQCTALTIVLYMIKRGYTSSFEAESTMFMPRLLNCATVATHPKLSHAQAVDSAHLDITHDQLLGYLNQGVPYALFRDLFNSVF